MLDTIRSSTQLHTHPASIVDGAGVVNKFEKEVIEEVSAPRVTESVGVLLEYGSEADVVDDDEALAAAVVVEVLDPTVRDKVTHQASAA